MTDEYILDQINNHNGSIHIDATNHDELRLMIEFIERNSLINTTKNYLYLLLKQEIDIINYVKNPYIIKWSHNSFCFTDNKGHNYLGTVTELFKKSLKKL